MVDATSMSVIKRNEYVNGERTHKEYYGQFINAGVKNIVLMRFGIEKLVSSYKDDENFNSIITPLASWDSLSDCIASAIDRDLLRESKEWEDKKTYPWSLSDGVCIAKEAARQLVKELV